MNHPYADILHHPYPFPTDRPRMDMADRAAQFSPFAALVGYEQSIAETARRTVQPIELTEEAKEELNRRLTRLLEIPEAPVTITYFAPDPRKDGGAYVEASGRIRTVDRIHRVLRFTDGTAYWLQDIIRLESPLL